MFALSFFLINFALRSDMTVSVAFILSNLTMEKEINVDGLTFVPYLTSDRIAEQVERVANEIRNDLGDSCPIFICVLNGAFMFAADLYREIGINNSVITFVKYSSYEGTKSTGNIKEVIGLKEDISGRDVVIIEDIVDTGLTAVKMIEDLRSRNPRSIRFATLLHKPESCKTGFTPDYVAFTIPPKFIIGYGLDLDGKVRNLPDIYVIKEEAENIDIDNKMKDTLNVVLFGAPGSGKGTQSAKLIDKYGLYHISTGEVLRDHIKRGTELGKIADSYISEGQLIPDDLMIKILDDVLEKEAADKKGVVFDGFPRTIPQAEALKELLKKRGTDLHAVIGLEVPEEELMERMLLRGKETGRADDNPETIKNRLKVYHDQTHPLREYYTKEGKYLPINGTGIVDEIFNEIAKGLKEKVGR